MPSRRIALVAGLIFASLLLGLSLLHAQPESVRWQPLTLPQALDKAKTSNQRVLVKFDATWCPACKALERELLSTREGARLTSDMVAVKFDFDTEANRPLIEQYVVMSLPLVLVLAPDGSELGRISDYDAKDKWVAQFQAAKVAPDPMPALRAAWDKNPTDSRAALALGEALLVRGQPDQGEALLDRVTWMQGNPEDAAQALFLLGRYYQRVRKDPRTARHIWRDLATRFPDSEWASGAWSWYARGEAEIGHPEVGLEALRAHARKAPESVGAAAQWASFVVKHKLEPERKPAAAAVQAVIAKATGEDRKELEELAGKLAAGF
ncbi:MAG: thioredoxin family protein [Deltaproteobacteria bacterium]|nr:thioredoxin family protein [Deltaproteobacteria bacterium]